MPKVSSTHLAARRLGILKAASRCLARKGVQGTGMRDVFRAANLSPGAVYSYFPGKEALVLAVADRSAAATDVFAEALAEAPPLSAAVLRGALTAAVGTGDLERLHLQLRAAALHSEELAAILRRRRRRIEHRLAERLGSAAVAGLALALCEGLAQARALEPAADLAGPIERAARLLEEAASDGDAEGVA